MTSDSWVASDLDEKDVLMGLFHEISSDNTLYQCMCFVISV